MKLRIRGDSIRLRLTQKEVAAVGNGQLVEEALNFGGGVKLRYSVEPAPIDALKATFADARLIVALPRETALAWANSSEVAMKSPQGACPVILVEKDFQCLKTRVNESEDESDMFPNPNEAHGHCT